MEITVADHPLIAHKVTLLRDVNTSSSQFRQLVDELVTLITFEATKSIATEVIEVKTPLAKTQGVRLTKPAPLVVPILRAGLGMLSGITKLLPDAEVGFLGIRRNEETLKPETYANRLPNDLKDREVIFLDPMLATGGSMIDALEFAFQRGAKSATAICILGAPEGIDALRRYSQVKGKEYDVRLFLAALDQGLNSVGFIVPGLGDAGDRLYGLN